MIILATILSGLSLLLSGLFLLQPKVIHLAFFAKLGAAALSPYWAIMGAVGAIIGGISGAYWAIPMGILGAGMVIWYVWRCTMWIDFWHYC